MNTKLTIRNLLVRASGVGGMLLPLLVLSCVLTSFAQAQSWSYAKTWHGSIFVNVRDFGAKGDGITDDTAAIQAAIDFNRNSTGDWAREASGLLRQFEPPFGEPSTKNFAVVYVPPGTYMISNSIIVWKGTHLMGDETMTPQFILKSGSLGFGAPNKKKPVLVSTNGHGINPASRNWMANSELAGGAANCTFFTQIENLDISIQSGNPGATGILWTVAQQTALRNIRITAVDAAIGLDLTGQADYGSGWVPTQAGGGTIEDISITGAGTGIRANGSQWTLRAVKLQGQTSYGVDLSNSWSWNFVNLTTSNVPVGFHYTLAPGGQLVIADSSIGGATPFVTDGSGNYYVENTAGITAPHSAKFSGPAYSNGVSVASGTIPMQRTLPLANRARPRMADTSIVNVHDLGIVGDGVTDNTAALQSAIDTYRTVFLPHGTYMVSNTLRVTSRTRLFGEGAASIMLMPNSAGFRDRKHPKPILLTPDDSNAQVVFANFWVQPGFWNPGSVLIQWGSGEGSGIWDVHLESGSDTCAIQLQLYGHGGGVFSSIGGWANQSGDTTGLSGSSTGPAWFYGVEFDHTPYPAYDIAGASNYYFFTAQDENSPVALQVAKSNHIFVYGGVFTKWGGTPENLVQFSDDSILNFYGLYMRNLQSINITMPVNGSSGVRIVGSPEAWTPLTVLSFPALAAP